MMKHSVFVAAFLLFLVGCQTVDTGPDDSEIPDSDSSEPVEAPPSSNILQDIEARILQAKNEGFESLRTTKFDEIRSELDEQIESSDPAENYLRNYWRAFLNYQQAQIELIARNQHESIELIKEAISILQAVDPKDVETHALLAMCFHMSAALDQAKTFSFVTQGLDQVAQAEAISSNNIRVMLAKLRLALVPGFGQDPESEDIVDTALALGIENEGSSPSWGRPRLFEIKVFLLMRASNFAEAQEVVASALAEFPDDFGLRQMKDAIPAH